MLQNEVDDFKKVVQDYKTEMKTIFEGLKADFEKASYFSKQGLDQ